MAGRLAAVVLPSARWDGRWHKHTSCQAAAARLPPSPDAVPGAGLWNITGPARRPLQPLSVELGPGLLANIFDGIQRPLKQIAQQSGDVFIPRGVNVPALDPSKMWEFLPTTFKVRARRLECALGLTGGRAGSSARVVSETSCRLAAAGVATRGGGPPPPPPSLRCAPPAPPRLPVRGRWATASQPATSTPP